MKDIVVYTAISDGYDILNRPIELWRKEAAFVAFLNEPQMVDGWEIRPLYRRFSDPCRNAKIHKVLSHKYFPTAQYSLWIDGSVLITSKLALASLIKHYLAECDLAVFKHRCRQCIYEEGEYCILKGMDSRLVIERQLKKYYAKGYPVNNGLAECTVLLRRHTDNIRRFNEMWHREIRSHSRRDQLSFNYVAKALELKFAYFSGDMLNTQHFNWLPHRSTRVRIYEPKCADLNGMNSQLSPHKF